MTTNVNLSLYFSGPIPPGFDANANIDLAKQYAASHTPGEVLDWFNHMARNNKDGHLPQSVSWDFKQIDPRYADFGNFWYGFIGKAVGISDAALKIAAGVAQGKANGLSDSGAVWRTLTAPEYGDNPGDQAQIQSGINAAATTRIAEPDRITNTNLVIARLSGDIKNFQGTLPAPAYDSSTTSTIGLPSPIFEYVNPHTVKILAGGNLYRIAELEFKSGNNISAEDLRIFNSIADPTKLGINSLVMVPKRVGDSLQIQFDAVLYSLNPRTGEYEFSTKDLQGNAVKWQRMVGPDGKYRDRYAVTSASDGSVQETFSPVANAYGIDFQNLVPNSLITLDTAGDFSRADRIDKNSVDLNAGRGDTNNLPAEVKLSGDLANASPALKAEISRIASEGQNTWAAEGRDARQVNNSYTPPTDVAPLINSLGMAASESLVNPVWDNRPASNSGSTSTAPSTTQPPTTTQSSSPVRLGPAQISINQYLMNGMEVITTRFEDPYGKTREIGKEREGLIIRIDGLIDDRPAPDDAVLIHSSSFTLSDSNFYDALSYADGGSDGFDDGNTVDFANNILVAAGLARNGVGDQQYSFTATPITIDPALRIPGLAAYLSIATLSGQYAFDTAYVMGNSWSTLWGDDQGYWALEDIARIVAILGEPSSQAYFDLFNDAWTAAGGSPIAIDLTGDGVNTISFASSTVKFDVSGDNVADQTGWLSAQDAFVAYDQNGNGKIDGVNELFGGLQRGQGYAKLAEFDSNHDQVISNLDQSFSSLRLWRDSNSNGVTDTGELMSLADGKVSGLDLRYLTQEVRDQGNLLGEVSTATVNGVKRPMADVYFRFVDGATTSSGTGQIVSTDAGTKSYISNNTLGEILSTANKAVNNLYAGSGNDSLTGDAGINWLSGGNGSDSFNAEAGDDVLLVDAADSQVNIHAGAGIDLIRVTGGAGVVLNLAIVEAEVAEGGDGNDVFIGGGRSTVVISGGSGDDILVGSAANDVLAGDAGNDLVDGGAGDDLVRGGVGDDVLIGGLGVDILAGGVGDDVYGVDNTLDTVFENANEGNDTMQSTVSYTLSTNVENLTLMGNDALNGTGNALNNTITGNSAANVLDGGAGADTLNGGDGDDRYRFNLGSGCDTLVDRSGNDRIVFGAGISAAQTSASMANGQVTLSVTSGDSVSFAAAAFNNYAIEQFEFSNGSVLSTTWLNTLLDTAPTGANKTLTLNEDGNYVITAADLGFVDVNPGDSLSAVRIDSFPVAGSLKLNGTAVTTAQVISAADLAAARLLFSPAANANGNSYASLSFSVKDQYGAFDVAPNTLTFNVTAVNDAPSLTGTKAALAAGTEDTTYTVTQTSLLAGFSDVEGSALSVVGLSASNGALSAFNAATGSWTFTPNANYNGTVNLSYGVSDGTINTPATQSFTLAAVNDAPTLTAFAAPLATGNEDSEALVTFAQLLAQGNEADVDGTVSAFVVKAVSSGNLRIGATAATATAWNATTNNTVDATRSAYWAPTLNANGALNAFTAVAKDNGGAESSTAIQAKVMVTPVNDAPTGTVTVSGTATQNQILTAANTLADADGLGMMNYQWLANGTVIAGATGSTLTLGQAQVGKAISVKASYADAQGTAESATSAVTGTVANVNDTPTGTVTVLRGGSPLTATTTVQQGDVLSVGSTLADVDGLGALTYQWQSSANGTTWSAISGATAASITLISTLAGQSLRVVVSYTDGFGTAESMTSMATAAVNRMVGTAGADTLAGTAGTDRLEGLAASDSYVVNHAGDVVVENVNEGIDTVSSSVDYTLTANVENLTLTGAAALNGTGNDLNNALTGNSGNNTLTGGAGDDSLDGGLGNDTLKGGLGSDSYGIDSALDTVIELAGEGMDTVLTGLDGYTLAANVENLTLGGTAAIGGTGNSLDNILTGNSGANLLMGGYGADTLVGGNGDDMLDGLPPALGTSITVYVMGPTTAKYSVDRGVTTSFALVDGMIPGVSAGQSLEVQGGVNPVKVYVTPGSRVDARSLHTNGDSIYLSGKFADYSQAVDQGTGVYTFTRIAGLPAGQNESVMVTVTVENVHLYFTDGSMGFNAFADARLLDFNTDVYHPIQQSWLTGGAQAWPASIPLLSQGADRLVGGLGNDNYFVDDAGDMVVENASEGTDTVRASISYALGANVENLALTGTALNGMGNSLANTITGNSGINVLMGGYGTDTLIGGNGDDVLDGLAPALGASIIISVVGATAANYFVDGGPATSLAFVGGVLPNVSAGQSLQVLGSMSPVKVYVTAGSRVDASMRTSAGDCIYLSGKLADYSQAINQDSGVYTFTRIAGLPAGQSESAMVLVSNTDTRLYFSDGYLVINCIADARLMDIGTFVFHPIQQSWLTGGAQAWPAGFPLLSQGADQLVGGLGNDCYFVDDAGDVVVENAGEGTDTVRSSINCTLSANVENLTLTGAAAINGRGNTLNNTLIGNSAANVLDGGASNDVLQGGWGNDTLTGGAGDDVVDRATSESIKMVGPIGGLAKLVTGDQVISEVAISGGWLPSCRVGQTLQILGSSSVDKVYVTAGSSVDATSLGGGVDEIYLTGRLGDYTAAYSGNTITLTRQSGLPAGQAEVVKLSGGTAVQLDNLYFSDGFVKTNAFFNSLKANTAVVLDTSQRTDASVAPAVFSEGADVMAGGLGNDIFMVDDAVDVVTELAGEGTDTVQSYLASYTLTANVENLTLLGNLSAGGTGNALANVLCGNAGNNTLAGGTGSDTYTAYRGMGQDRIIENDATAGDTDVLSFGADVATNQLWFSHAGNDLAINIIGTSDKMTMQNWYLGNQYHVEQIKTSDNKVLLDTQIENLVQAMAGFAPPAMGQTNLAASQQTALAPVLAANWH